MSWRFRKSFKVIPGVRINLSNRGFSTTFGVAPFSVNVGPHGIHGNLSIPGTGLSNRVRLDLPKPTPDVSSNAKGYVEDIEVIKSGSTELMNSPALDQLRRILTDANAERTAIESEISVGEPVYRLAADRFHKWNNGVLFKKLFKASFQTRKEEFEVANAKLQELRDQLRLTTVETEMHIEGKAADAYFKLRDAASALTETHSIWDILSRKAIDQKATRSAAVTAVERTPVKFALDKSDLVSWEQRVPLLRNKVGGDMYVYPGFVLYRASRQSFALIDFNEINLRFDLCKFIEDAGYPSDAKIHEYVWEKSNKDGSPDRRFAQNRQLPALLYGQLDLSSPSGLHEQYQFSNVDKAVEFCKAWESLSKALDEVKGE